MSSSGPPPTRLAPASLPHPPSRSPVSSAAAAAATWAAAGRHAAAVQENSDGLNFWCMRHRGCAAAQIGVGYTCSCGQPGEDFSRGLAVDIAGVPMLAGRRPAEFEQAFIAALARSRHFGIRALVPSGVSRPSGQVLSQVLSKSSLCPQLLLGRASADAWQCRGLRPGGPSGCGEV